MSRHTKKTKAIDFHIGNKVYETRLTVGMSRLQLAKKIGVTQQQLEKYEKSLNRVTAARLALIAEALNVPIMNFYQGVVDVAYPVKRQRQAMEHARNYMRATQQEQTAIYELTKILTRGRK